MRFRQKPNRPKADEQLAYSGGPEETATVAWGYPTTHRSARAKIVFGEQTGTGGGYFRPWFWFRSRPVFYFMRRRVAWACQVDPNCAGAIAGLQ
jgi:hypothetical protein